MIRASLYSLLILLTLQSCSKMGPAGIFKKRSLHQIYLQQLESAGLNKSAMGMQWAAAATASLGNPLTVTLPYRETGYFSPQEVKAAAIRFNTKRGEKITISLTKRPSSVKIYLDLWEYKEGQPPEDLAFADTVGNPLVFDADDRTAFILRLQPELLSGGEYTLTIEKGPVLSYPVSNPKGNKIGSFFGDGRDAGGRLHEGIDMFSPFHTPVVAAAPGVVTRVTENTLGGKVVFMRPENKSYSLYYAHLDSQIARSGQVVKAGDTLGLMGNTGNARTTPPHLHFGIYTSSGAIDPLPFVDLRTSQPLKITADVSRLGGSLTTVKGAVLHPADRTATTSGIPLPLRTPLTIEAVTGPFFKVKLPDGRTGFIAEMYTSKAATGEKLAIKNSKPLFDQPDSLAARKQILSPGASVNVIGKFNGFNLIKTQDDTIGWIAQ